MQVSSKRVTITTTATQILAADKTRVHAIVQTLTADIANTISLGADVVTAGTGYRIFKPSDGGRPLEIPTEASESELWGIVASGSQTVEVIEFAK